MQAIAKAQDHQSYVVTTGTGSGKSLSFFIPIIERILKAAGVTFEGHDVPGVLHAVERARLHHAQIAAGARNAALRWAERPGVQRFLAAMLAASGAPGGRGASA